MTRLSCRGDGRLARERMHYRGVAVVLDSDAVVGFLDRDGALHGAADAAVRDVIGEHRILVSAVTYALVMTGARLGDHDEAAVGGFFAELISAAKVSGLSCTVRLLD